MVLASLSRYTPRFCQSFQGIPSKVLALLSRYTRWLGSQGIPSKVLALLSRYSKHLTTLKDPKALKVATSSRGTVSKTHCRPGNLSDPKVLLLSNELLKCGYMALNRGYGPETQPKCKQPHMA